MVKCNGCGFEMVCAHCVAKLKKKGGNCGNVR